jgi:large subunit ribosomal protein L15
MQIHHLQSNSSNKTKKRVGRGGKRGKTSGKGHKGQKARSGTRKQRPEIRDVIKKIPKLRGYKFNSVKDKPIAVNLSDLNSTFSDGDKVTPKILLEKGLNRKKGGVARKVKILGQGNIEKKVLIYDCQVSASAREAIEKVGGKISN